MIEPNTIDKGHRPRGHWRLIYKIAISLAGFVVAYSATSFVPSQQRDETLWNMGASLFIAGIIFVTQYLVDVERRMDSMEHALETHLVGTGNQLARHAAATEERMREGFSKIQLATELFNLSEASQLNPDELTRMTKLVRNSTKISSEAPHLLQVFAQAEIASLSDCITQLSNNADVNYEGEDRDWLLGLTQAAKKVIQATSLTTVDAGGRSSTDGGLWWSDLGRRYLDRQRQAIRRGVKIQRIFIFNQAGLSTENMLAVLRIHVSNGVEVRTMYTPEGSTFHYGLRDFVIFDGVLSYQSTPAESLGSRDPVIVNTTLVTAPAKVLERQIAFEELWEKARRVELDANGDVVVEPANGPTLTATPDP